MSAPQRLVRIEYKYEFVDQEGNFEDYVYMKENVYLNYEDKDMLFKIVNNFLDITDKSKVLKDVAGVKYLGLRLI